MRPTSMLIALALAGSLAAGCGVKKDVHQKALDDLAATKSQLGTAETELAAANGRVAELEAEVAKTQKALASSEEVSAGQLEKLGAVKEELEEVRRQREATKQRLAAFRELNDRFRSLVDTGKLEVAFRNGQMVLKLPAGVLFPSGRAKLSSDGETALAEVLTILLEFKDRRFVVAGHTDDRPIKTRKFKNNWELSQARALSVVSAMTEAGFDGKNLGAAGYGEFDPVASNETPEGRQLNRRIEIILVPDLSELPNLVPGNET